MTRDDKDVTETTSRGIFSISMTNFSNDEYKRGDLLFRELTERDYGIDGEIEVLKQGEPTGRIAKIQLKSTEKIIHKLVRSNEVSCYGISKSNLSYCRQNNYPVMLVLLSTADWKFYFIDLQSVYKGKIPEIGNKGSGTVRIPYENNSDNLEKFVEIVNSYYDKPEPIKITGDRQTITQNDMDEDQIVSSYEFQLDQIPTDGEHREVNWDGDVIAEGFYKNGELITGTEYDYLIRVVEGQLIINPDCVYATDDFKYERMESYGKDGFLLSEPYIESEGMDSYYVVDLEVDETTEQMVNIRTLESFLEEKATTMRNLYLQIKAD